MANNINVRANVDKAAGEVDRMNRIRALAEAEVKEMRARLDAMGPLPAPRTEQLP
jgi:hypothetical protein